MAMRSCDGWCGDTLYNEDDLFYGPDPFQWEIHGNETPVWYCRECYDLSADEI